jgi:hypothetical protein
MHSVTVESSTHLAIAQSSYPSPCFQGLTKVTRRIMRVITAPFRPSRTECETYSTASHRDACRAFTFSEDPAAMRAYPNYRSTPRSPSSLATAASRSWVYSHANELPSRAVIGRSSGSLNPYPPLSPLSADGRDLDLERERNLDLDPPPSYDQASTMRPAFDQAAGAPPSYHEPSNTPPSYDWAMATANGQLQARATSLSRPSGPTRR